VKRRIVTSIVGVATVAVLVLGIPLSIAFAHLYRDQEVLRLERTASETRRTVDVATLGTADPIELPDVTGTRIAVYDAHGRRVAGAGPARADATVQRALEGTVRDGRLRGDLVAAVPINGNEQIIGAVRASRPVSVVDDRARRTWFVMALISAGAIGIAALLARVLARRLVRPVTTLASVADRLGDGDFSVRTRPSGVDELDHLAAALDSTAERLGDLVARERAFSSDASHQLRTPITALRAHIESALLTPGVDLHAALVGALEPIDRLESTVEHLLRLARDLPLQGQPLDLDGLVSEAERDWHGLLAATRRPLRVAADPGLPAPAVSGIAVRQILDVLIDNAARHGAGVITLSVRHVPGGVVLEVSDEGTSILDPQAIFTRREGNGHGIGLALARTLAEAEGGRLVLECVGPAPRFALVLPVAASSQHERGWVDADA
jgi:signal transduction histidine kinase